MTFTQQDIQALVQSQRDFFKQGHTLELKWRKEQLKKLREAIKDNEDKICDALEKELGKSKLESYLCEIGPSIAEINEMISGLSGWARSEIHFSGILCFPSIITRVHKMPYGTTLLISPFNFPILLSIGVLAASIAGGNTAIIKTSSKTPQCSSVLKEMISNIFPDHYVAVVEGGHEVADMCLDQRFDKIFYTGSPAIGKHVLEKAAANLTPVALELGGENGNWCIIRKDADLDDAARKIAFFKLCNCGQICIDVNQVAVEEDVAEDFINTLKAQFERQIGQDALLNDEYPKLITDAAFQKCAAKADEYRKRIVFGGKGDASIRKYQPTIIYPVGIDEEIVKHELFSPLLPIVTFKASEIKTVLETIESREHPLAMYVLTKDMKWAGKVMKTHQFGGGCINEVCLQLMVKGVPFNGTGHSGMGAYHGKWGFREFTHPQTVLEGKCHFNLSLREHPYKGRSESIRMKLLRLLER